MDYNKSLGVVQMGRLRQDAALYDTPDERPLLETLTVSGKNKKKSGPQPLKGNRQTSLTLRVEDPTTSWTPLDVMWYASTASPYRGGEKKRVEIVTDVSLWHVPGNAPIPLRWVLVRPVEDAKGHNGNTDSRKSGRCSSRKGAAFFSTDVHATPEHLHTLVKQILASYAERWTIEVFFEEVRACLGFETQRGWTNTTIGRTTPCLFGVFSLAVVLAKQLYPSTLPMKQAAWYLKDEATFRDVLCAVRQHIWGQNHSVEKFGNTTRSSKTDDLCTIPRSLFRALQNIACYAA